MSDEPLDLRSLADVEEPELVREALRTFRRRFLTRYLWVVLAAVLAAGAIWWAVQPNSLAERIDAATPRDVPGLSWHTQGVDVGLADVVRLRDGVGFRFVVIPRSEAAQFCISMPESNDREFPVDGFDAYFELPRSTTGVYQATIGCNSRRIEPLRIDLQSMHVDDSIWKES
jgi:hypothetical protein